MDESDILRLGQSPCVPEAFAGRLVVPRVVAHVGQRERLYQPSAHCLVQLDPVIRLGPTLVSWDAFAALLRIARRSFGQRQSRNQSEELEKKRVHGDSLQLCYHHASQTWPLSRRFCIMLTRFFPAPALAVASQNSHRSVLPCNQPHCQQVPAFGMRSGQRLRAERIYFYKQMEPAHSHVKPHCC